MIPNCRGCKDEFEEAVRMVKKGFHVATRKDWPLSENILKRGHYALIIVDDCGKVIMY